MKLQAYIQDGAGGMAALTPSASGVQVSSGYYIAADVDALLASIRAAVDAERATLPDCLMISKLAYHFGDKWAASRLEPVAKVRAALDALLSGAEVDR